MKRKSGSGKSSAQQATDVPSSSVPRGFVALIFLSGFAALIYQILWMRQLGLVFGNSAHAAAMTLAVFFAGLAAGSGFWGRRSARIARPLHAYAWLEFGIGAAGLLCMPLLMVYQSIYPALHQSLAGSGLWLVKGLLAFAMVFPPAFLMGGTIPLIGRCLIDAPQRFGRTAAAIYGINTLGAALGAFAAAFVMLPALGFRLSCLLAVAASSLVAVLALRLGRRIDLPAAMEDASKPSAKRDPAAVPAWLIRVLAFISGFNVLALEVLWTRMFAQVHENSVYSFAAVLIVVLIALAGGAWLAKHLAARAIHPMTTLVTLCVLAGLAVCVAPFSFHLLTGGLRMLPEHGSFALYVLQLFATALAAIGPSAVVLGALFPYLMKGEERHTRQAGRSLGVLTAINTVGAILGSLICGFVMLESLGLWRSMQVLALAYLLVALLLPSRGRMSASAAKAFAVVFAVLAFSALDPTRLPLTAVDPDEGPQEVVERWEASDCTVTVVRKSNGEHAIRVNANYSLGSSEAYMSQIFQSRVPLLAYPQTKSLFYLGMGTGITAGESLDRKSFPNVEKVTVCELSPSVVIAAKKYFGGFDGAPDLVNDLFRDQRAQVLVADGRNRLMADPTRYDMINADLFLPYRSGAGSLYSLEHFQTARQRLAPGGVFVQWLPLYQLSEREFGVIARTMLEAFDHVSLWRSNLQAGGEVVALIGHQDATPLLAETSGGSDDLRRALNGVDADNLLQMRLPVNEQTILMFYCGNLSGSRQRFMAYPLNTDDQPVIEYGTPRSLHRMDGDQRPHFVGERFADLVDELLAATPPDSDPLLARRSPANRRLPLAGAAYHRASIATADRDPQALRDQWDRFRDHWLAATTPAGE